MMTSLPVLVTSALLAVWLGTAWWQVRKPLPRGLHLCGAWHEAREPALLLDETWLDTAGRQHCRQQIFDEWLHLIGQARRRVVIDVFQFSPLADGQKSCHRPIASELCQALLRRKEEVSALDVLVITDPINNCYGDRLPAHLAALRRAGIQVVITDLRPGRDPNPLWTALWRLAFQWLGAPPAQGGWLPNPLGPGRVSLRCYLSVLNLNANHRKVLVVDQGEEWLAVVGSANADDGSSAYRDTALRLRGPAALELLHSELAIAAFSGASPSPGPCPTASPFLGIPRLRVLTEGAIRDALLLLIDQARDEEYLDINALYLAHRRVIRALCRAQARGVTVRLLLDPNASHFGRRSPGLPNRPVARKLHAAGLAIRWSAVPDIHAHSKVLLRHGSKRPAELLVGSANYTRRSLDDYNFEAAVHLVAGHDHPVIRRARESFSRYWHNCDGELHSHPYTAFDDATRWRYWRYRLMEASGWCLF